jgi:hypothetical protein
MGPLEARRARLLAAESQQADIVADPLARELPQIAFEQFQYLRGCQALPVAQSLTQSVRAVAAPDPARFDQPVGVEKHAVTRSEPLRTLPTIDL